MIEIESPVLAVEGGPRAIPYDPPKAPRWNGEEKEFLGEMVQQSSLFYWNGPQTQRLLSRFREVYPFEHVMPCSSGTAAIHIALATAQIGWGDEVITSPITDMGSVIGILYQQAVPVFADIDPQTYNMSAASVEACITERTKAIVAIHLSGNPCELGELRALADRHGLILIEDCAQAWCARWQGTPVGLIGDFGCYSLNDFKHISSGDGGIVATNNPKYGPLLQKYGDKGYSRDGGARMPEILGLNYRISEPQSAVAAAQMARVEEITRNQNEMGTLLTSLLEGLPGLILHHIAPGNYSTFWFYILRLMPEQFTCTRDEFAAAVAAEGFQCGPGYIRVPLYRYPVFQNHNFSPKGWPVRDQGATTVDYRKVHCPEAEAMLKECITMPLPLGGDMDYIRDGAVAIRKVFHRYRR
jgi:dTDP-4-amino-4,6-dideoxygalactose transaminase